MALDFMASKIEKEVLNTSHIYSMEEDEHEMLQNLAQPIEDYPFLRRFNDYYKDSAFVTDEVFALLHEVEKIEKKNPGTLTVMSQFYQFLQETTQRQENIYVFCD